MFSCYTTVYTYYMFIVFTEATYLMTDEPPYCTGVCIRVYSIERKFLISMVYSRIIFDVICVEIHL